MKTYLTFSQNARFYSWLLKNKDLCVRATGKNPIDYLSKPISQADLKSLPYSHVDFPDRVQLWMNKHCPYWYIKTPVKGLYWLKLRMWFFRLTRNHKIKHNENRQR